MKTTFIKASFLATGLIASGTNATRADVIADWTFETSAPASAGSISPEVGYGSASGSHVGTAVYSSPSGNGSTHSFSANTWAVGDYYQFQVSTLGYTSVSIQWDQTSSSTGPLDFILQYSVDNITYTPVGSAYSVSANASPNPAWNTTTASSLFTMSPSLSSISGSVDNSGPVYFRLVDYDTTSEGGNGGIVATGGTDRVDNFVVSGILTPVPEPVNVALGVFGGVMGLVALARSKPVKRLCGKI